MVSGNLGDGVYAKGNVDVEGGTISGNARGVYCGKDLTLMGATVSSNFNDSNRSFVEGAGVIGRNSVNISDAVITGNTSLYGAGAGVYGGVVQITNSQITNNTLGTPIGANNRIYGGAGICAHVSVTITASTISGNRTLDPFYKGGGIFARYVTATDSTISNNEAAGSTGGGVYAQGQITAVRCTISQNRTLGDVRQLGNRYGGGGAFAMNGVMLDHCTVSGNYTKGKYAVGGAIATARLLTVQDSLVTGNSTAGQTALGGALSGAVALIRATISNNSTSGDSANGGAISGLVSATDSLIVGNRTSGKSAFGGGFSAHSRR